MRKDTLFLEYQIARFGSLSIQQMEFLCAGKCSRATIYRILDDLAKKNLIKRIPHAEGAQFLFTPKEALLERMFGMDREPCTALNENELFHNILVTESILALSKYAFVSGVATEYEIKPSEFLKFCYNRRPDGIIQISNQEDVFSLALEVEWSQKDERRLNELLEKYQKTFLSGMPCAGLILVAGHHTIEERYQSKISKLPPEIENRIIVTSFDGLSRLNSKYFGHLETTARNNLEKAATLSQGVPTFFPINSIPPFKRTSL